MSWIRPVEMNMDVSRTLSEGRWNNCLLVTIQKVALYTVVPFLLIASFEAIVKNLICINTINAVISVINVGHELYKIASLSSG